VEEMNTYKPFKAVAGFMGVYHVLIGILGLASGDVAARVGAAVYGAHVEVTPMFSYMAKYLAAYVIGFGVMMLIMASDPVKYRKLVYVAVLLAVIRILSRLVFASELQAAFGIGMNRSLLTIAIVAILNLGLLLLMPKQD
jgi:hypothetical protein